MDKRVFSSSFIVCFYVIEDNQMFSSLTPKDLGWVGVGGFKGIMITLRNYRY